MKVFSITVTRLIINIAQEEEVFIETLKFHARHLARTKLMPKDIARAAQWFPRYGKFFDLGIIVLFNTCAAIKLSN